ncbi:glycosyltransferase [Microbacterium bovistercoris]|uniref:Glycosyltransferase n=1 Tax=Microbacterium bovistercoris TaxID=2293570 RepID=A0A371NXW1_9MICO|nr:glycosyltransferase [Microbacterium bovistercoris]REJ07578.1 glycosyltransferase [Microbacterium bovistercoris]
MKVLVVTTWLPTKEQPDAGSFIVRDIELLCRDHDVEVLHLTPGGETLPLPGDRTALLTVPMSPANPISVRRAARAIAERSREADLVHSMAPSTLLPFLFVNPGRPWVHTEHWSALLAPSTVGIAARAAIPLTMRLIRRPDLVIAVGQRLAEAIKRSRVGPTVVIPNSVERPAKLHERPRGTPTILASVGGLVPRKGPDVAIRALALLRDRGEDVRLVWAGDGPMRDELAALAVQLEVEDRVQFLGRIAPEAVGDVLAEADAFLLPTTMETFGVAIAEALVAGRPVVVGADGEQAAFVAEPDGVLVQLQTPEAYADAVQRVLGLNAGRSAVEIAAATTARFDEDTRRTAYAAAYERVAADSSGPDVDVVIAVHDSGRRIDRAVQSALTSKSVARVIVVCHGVEPGAIREAAAVDDARAEYIDFRDGIRSPAGPFNRGLESATGRFLAVMGSDDELAPGAIDAWRRTAMRDRADAVIAPVRHARGLRVPTPPTLRHRRLQGAKDRLAYRTAPLGIFNRERFGDLRFTPGLATGEDLAFSIRIWFSGAVISRHVAGDEYIIHDGDGRVTFSTRPLADELRAVELLIDDPGMLALPARDRTAIAVKLWRVTVFGAAHQRIEEWGPSDREWLVGLVAALREFAPEAIDLLSRADRDLVEALASLVATDRMVDELSRRRRRFATPSALMTRKMTVMFARDAPLRFIVASLLARYR